MTPKLNDELRQALQEQGGTVKVQDDQTHQMYVLTESGFFKRAVQALQEQEDHAAIQAGIDAMEKGKVLTLDDLDRRIQSRLSAA